MKKCLCVLTMSLLAFVGFSSEAFSSTDPFADPRPIYQDFDWAFGSTEYVSQATNGQWYNTGLNPHVGQSQGDGTAYNDRRRGSYWASSESYNDKLNGFSLSNNIGNWIDAIGDGEATIRYTIREDYSPLIDNSDIVELTGFGIETIVKYGVGVTDSLGLSQGDDVTALEWNVNFDDENLVYDHRNALQGCGFAPFVGRNMDDETVYMTWGASAELDGDDNLTGTTRTNKTWDGTTNGRKTHNTYGLAMNGNTGESMGVVTFDGTNWFLPVTVGATTHWQQMDVPYSESGYPTSSGAVIQWYDDYDLYLAGAIPNPGGSGVSGRYVLERIDEFLGTYTGTGWAHHADVCYEARTYNPYRNADGPESPYEWVYDDSGDMYVPTDTTLHPTPSSDPLTRAHELVGNHPAFPDDDTWGEGESSDENIWENQPGGVVGGKVSRGLLVDSWRLAGLMLGQEFWSDGYFWSGEIGAVAERTWAEEFMDLGWWGSGLYPDNKLPVWTWNGSEWVPTDGYGTIAKHRIWGWVNDYTDTPVAGYDALNNFMKYAFDIDALVVEDVDGDGEFDVGQDYILFSVVDDGLYDKYQQWGILESSSNTEVDAFFAGHYFDGDTIFLYDGTSVTTFFDAEEGIFFGQVSSAGDDSPLWGGTAYYDIDALDIDIIPEPSTIFLMIGSASGLAVLAGIMRKKLR